MKDKTNTSDDSQSRQLPEQAGKQKENDGLTLIAESLRDTNKLLLRVSRRMEKFEEKMRQIEDKIDNQSSSVSSSASSTPARTRKKAIPLEVRVS